MEAAKDPKPPRRQTTRYRARVVEESKVQKTLDEMAGEGWRLMGFEKARPERQGSSIHGDRYETEWMLMWEKQDCSR